MENKALISDIILQYMQDGVVLIGNHGRIIQISQNAKKILNIKDDELDQTISSLFFKDHRNDNFYELVPLGYSKASGIEFIINYLGIPFENTYAIGDSTNDLSMLKYVQHSIAMGNSTPALFDLVEYITTDIDKDGIFNALKHYKLI